MISARTLELRRAAFWVLFVSLIAFCRSPAIALFCGIVFAATIKNPLVALTKKLVSTCLSCAIVCMGAGMNLLFIGDVGLRGLSYTLVTIAATMILSLIMGRVLSLERELSLLLGAGTAICGGSAIAALSNSINAKMENVSIATAIVFLLNALALFIFPVIGSALGLSESEFGLWAALAVHDTSSVVATAERFGEQALQIATTVKLARALWIAPLSIAITYCVAKSDGKRVFYLPWFIVGFVALSTLSTYVPDLAIYALIATLSKPFLVAALFLVGANISVQSLQAVSARGLLHGVLLWFIVSVLSLIAIQHHMITY